MPMSIMMMRTSISICVSVTVCAACCGSLMSQDTPGGVAMIAPTQIDIRMPVGKPGFRVMREMSRYGFNYLYDAEHSKPGEWRHLEITRQNKNDFDRRVKVIYTLTASVKNGQAFPFLGEIYECDTMNARLVKREGKSLRHGDWEHRIGVLYRIDLALADIPRSQLSLTIEELEVPTQDISTKERVKVELIFSEGQNLTLPDGSLARSSQSTWVEVGDHIESACCDLILERIVGPDPATNSKGWAEFTVKEKGSGTK